MEEYIEDDLADDSGDEKRMEHVELAAGRKAAWKRKAKGLEGATITGEVTAVHCSLWGKGSYSSHWPSCGEATLD